MRQLRPRDPHLLLPATAGLHPRGGLVLCNLCIIISKDEWGWEGRGWEGRGWEGGGWEGRGWEGRGWEGRYVEYGTVLSMSSDVNSVCAVR